MKNIIGIKELRQNIDKYTAHVKKGEVLIVMRRSKPLFKITSVDEGEWEEVVLLRFAREEWLSKILFLDYNSQMHGRNKKGA